MKLKKIVSAVIAGCMLLAGGGIINQILKPMTDVQAAGKARVSVHDPSIIKDPKSGTYYVFGSHGDAAKSTDLQNWKVFTNGYATTNNVEFGNMPQNLKKAFDWCGENMEDAKPYAIWAPDVIWNPDFVNANGTKGAYVMYFCTSSTYIRSVICFATAQKIEGPYTFQDTLIYTGFTENDQYVQGGGRNVNKKYTSTNIDELIASGEVTYNSSWFNKSNYNNQLFPNAIDPTIYYSPDGSKMYMTYGSWSGGIFTLEIDKKTGKCIHPKTGTTSDGRMVDSYFGTKISGGYGKSGEGPFIDYNPDNGYYYLWVTYGGLFSEGGYNMRVFRAKSPLGPFTDAAGNKAVLGASTNLDSVGLKVMGNHKFSTNPTAYMACGHNSVLRDDDGRWYLFNHARFNDGTEYHEVRVHSIQFNSQDWPVVAPNEYSGDAIDAGGYEAKDIAGTYEYINHGNDTGTTKIYNSQNITLSADGKISGAVSGTWSEGAGSADAEITIGGQKYYGKFLAAYDEAGKKVMSFTAVGSNNQTIWGNKTTAFTGTPRKGGFSAASFSEGSVYRIKNVNSGLYLTVDGSGANGANVIQSDAKASAASTWKLYNAENGYYYIASCTGDGGTYVLDVTGKKADNGTNMEIYKFGKGENQKYMFTKNDDGSYKIRTKISNGASCVEIVDGKIDNGANVQEWEVNGANCQDWILEEAVNPGTAMDTKVAYTFTNVNSGYAMDIIDGKMEDGSNVQQWDSNGFDCQKWRLEKASYGENHYFLRSMMNQDYVLRAETAKDGANIIIQKYDANDTGMMFRFSKNLDGSYWIYCCSSNDTRLVEVASANTEMGGNIGLWSPTGNMCQNWNLTTEAIELPPVEFIRGDINDDKSVDSFDLVGLRNMLIANSGDERMNLAADMDGNGTVNAADLAQLQAFVLGKN